jgi:hypothetical protein
VSSPPLALTGSIRFHIAPDCRGKPVRPAAIKTALPIDALVALSQNLEDALSDRGSSFTSEDIFNGWCRRIFDAQYRNNPIIQAWARRHSVTPSEAITWDQIPALPTDAFKENEITCIPERERTTVFHSSGTTGQEPSRHLHGIASLRLYERSLRQGLFQCTRRDRFPELWSLTPPPEAAPHSSLAHMMGTLSQDPCPGSGRFWGRISPEGWMVDIDGLATALGRLDHPILLCGTAFNFVHVLDAQPRGLWPLPEGSMILETGGYKGRSRVLPRSELHRALSGRFGISPESILTEYGMSELSSPGYSIPTTEPEDHPLIQFPAWTRTRIVSPETGRPAAEGEMGLLQICDLANLWSAMMIQTADLARNDGGRIRLIGRSSTAEPRGCSLMSPNPRPS